MNAFLSGFYAAATAYRTAEPMPPNPHQWMSDSTNWRDWEEGAKEGARSVRIIYPLPDLVGLDPPPTSPIRG
jgi:hypothetical protein